MDEKRTPVLTVLALVATFAELVIAALTGWGTVTAVVGFAAFISGWLIYIIFSVVPLGLAVGALVRGERMVLPIVALVLLLLGGPASCTGAVYFKDRCMRDPQTGFRSSQNHCW